MEIDQLIFNMSAPRVANANSIGFPIGTTSEGRGVYGKVGQSVGRLGKPWEVDNIVREEATLSEKRRRDQGAGT